MKTISLAAKYRPQNFASIVGQDTVKSVLQKTAFQEKVAPAYLLSGTRGVGKTTIARVFAKALNCENKAENNGEPCNTCETCKRITSGAYVDVIEIDGASHRGIDDARKLRETVIYPPFEGKFRVVIIDEAHMLTRESFNALLKTFEEPPAHTTFLLATTESHKFPITIISRCQHFVFKSVPDALLSSNLKSVLEREKWEYENEAIDILTKRAAGSVRDSMSLLDQCLVLANDKKLTAELTRSLLGLASAEIIDKILNAIAENKSATIAYCVQEMTAQALDITYFTRNLAQLWRSFFLIKQEPQEACKILAISEDEAKTLQRQAEKFSTAFVHSAWQMTLEIQQKIIHSLEPAVALELFLINLTLLPKLLPINELRSDIENIASSPSIEDEKKKLTEKKSIEALPSPKNEEIEPPIAKASEEPLEDTIENPQEDIEEIQALEHSVETSVDLEKNSEESIGSLNFEDFISYLRENERHEILPIIQHITGFFSENEKGKLLSLKPSSEINAKQLKTKDNNALVLKLVEEWSSCAFTLEVLNADPVKTYTDMENELKEETLIQEIQSTFNAHIVFCESMHANSAHKKIKK